MPLLDKRTDTWKKYQATVDYVTNLNLYDRVEKSERFYSDRQWKNLPVGTPQPQVNFLKRAVNFMVAALRSYSMTVNFSPSKAPFDVVTEEYKQKYAKDLTAYREYLASEKQDVEGMSDNAVYKAELRAKKQNRVFEADWERLGMDYLNLTGLTKCAITGNMILYMYWNAMEYTGQANKGCVDVQLLDSTSYYAGNPNEIDVQKQPYIILSYRDVVANVKAEAKKNGVKEVDIKNIVSDTDYQTTAGEYGKREMEQNDDNSGKCTVVIHMRKDLETGAIFCTKATRSVVIRQEYDTKLSRYPVCLMAWDVVTNSCYGKGIVEGNIPNQVFVNTHLAMLQLWMSKNIGGNVIYDKTKIEEFPDGVADKIGVNGSTLDVAKLLESPQIPSNALQFGDMVVNQAMQMMGVSDVMLGNVSNPENRSAFVAVMEQASVPIESYKQRFRQYIEDFARNWLDMMRAYVKSDRWVEISDDNGLPYYEVLEKDDFDTPYNVRVDVGESTLFSDMAQAQTADLLMNAKAIPLSAYFEMLPDKMLKNKSSLIEQAKKNEAQQALMAQSQAMPPTSSTPEQVSLSQTIEPLPQI